MSGTTLQTYLVNASEMNFIFMALLLSAEMGLMNAYPDVSGAGDALAILTVVFNCILLLTVFCTLLAVIQYGEYDVHCFCVFSIVVVEHPARRR